MHSKKAIKEDCPQVHVRFCSLKNWYAEKNIHLPLESDPKLPFQLSFLLRPTLQPYQSSCHFQTGSSMFPFLCWSSA